MWRLALLPGLAWAVVFVVGSMILLFGVSLSTVDILGRPAELFGRPPVIGGNWENWRRLTEDPTIWRPVTRSFVFAGSATVIALLLALPAAYGIARYSGRFKLVLVLAILLPFWVNYLVRTYAWLVIVRDDGLMNQALTTVGLGPWQVTNTPTAVIGGLVYSFLPFMILPILVAMDRIPDHVLDASRDLYGGPVATFVLVSVPAARYGILAGCMFNFLPGFGDFITADMLGGPDTFMLGNFIQLAVYGGTDLPYGAVLSFAMLLVLSVLMFGYLFTLARADRRTSGSGDRGAL